MLLLREYELEKLEQNHISSLLLQLSNLSLIILVLKQIPNPEDVPIFFFNLPISIKCLDPSLNAATININ